MIVLSYHRYHFVIRIVRVKRILRQCLLHSQLIRQPKPVHAKLLLYYILEHIPSDCYFGGRIEYKRLGYCTYDLSQYNKSKAKIYHTPKPSSYCCKHSPHYYPFLDASYIQHPVRWKIDDDVHDLVGHGDDGYYCVGLVVSATDRDRYGGDNYPTHTVYEGQEGKYCEDSGAVGVALELLLGLLH